MNKQRELPFETPRETKAERSQRLLSGELGRVVKPASELQFNYHTATALATAKSTPQSKGSSV